MLPDVDVLCFFRVQLYNKLVGIAPLRLPNFSENIIGVSGMETRGLYMFINFSGCSERLAQDVPGVPASDQCK